MRERSRRREGRVGEAECRERAEERGRRAIIERRRSRGRSVQVVLTGIVGGGVGGWGVVGGECGWRWGVGFILRGGYAM